MKIVSSFLLLLLSLASFSRADYEMPPIEQVLQKAPMIVEAKVIGINPKKFVELEVVHRFRGLDTERKTLLLSQVALACEPSPPGHLPMKVGSRYVFVLTDANTLYEGSTFYRVTCDEEKPESWVVSDPKVAQLPNDPKAKTITRAQFVRLLESPGEEGN